MSLFYREQAGGAHGGESGEECQAGSIIQISIIQIQGKGDVRDSLADIKWAREMRYAPEFTIGETVRWSSTIIG